MKIFIEVKNRDGGYEVEFVMHWNFPVIPRVGETFWVESFLTNEQINSISSQIPEGRNWNFEDNNGFTVESIIWTSKTYANNIAGGRVIEKPYLHKNLACVITIKED